MTSSVAPSAGAPTSFPPAQTRTSSSSANPVLGKTWEPGGSTSTSVSYPDGVGDRFRRKARRERVRGSEDAGADELTQASSVPCHATTPMGWHSWHTLASPPRLVRTGGRIRSSQRPWSRIFRPVGQIQRGAGRARRPDYPGPRGGSPTRPVDRKNEGLERRPPPTGHQTAQGGAGSGLPNTWRQVRTYERLPFDDRTAVLDSSGGL